jgi:glutathione S-transferase
MDIYGIDVSFPTNKVRYVANAIGIDYSWNHLMPFSDQANAPEYRAKHPVGKVPAIQDGDFSLFESNAIIRYLARKHKSSLYPEDLQQQAVIDQWMDFASIHVGGAIARVFWNVIGVKFMGEEPDVRSLETGRAFLKRFLPVVEEQLGKTRYIAGDELSLADFAMLAPLDPCEAAGVDLSGYPNIVAWRNDLQSQDFYQIDRSFGEKLISDLMSA